MHPRNPYRDPPDFGALARHYPPLRQFLKQTPSRASTIGFKDPAAQRCLTEALLDRDFSLRVVLPKTRLCPPIPNRLNYVLWIQDIVRATVDGKAPSTRVKGIDIGTGASAIYPLLICALEPTWTMIATDIDSISLSYARANVHFNDLEDRVKILRVDETGPKFPALGYYARDDEYDFVMCNPPFYSSADEIQTSLDGKESMPYAVCTGAENEMITPGGEVAFVSKMIDESTDNMNRNRCKFYTSMLGKLSSIPVLVEHLKSKRITNYGITEFVQGQTRRWAIVWGWYWRLPDTLIRLDNPNPVLKGLMPPRTTMHLDHPLSAVKRLIQPLNMIQLSAESNDGFLVFFFCDTWSRKGRRKKGSMVGDPLEVQVTAKEGGVTLQWAKGYNAELFPSLVSHLARKLAGADSP